MRSLYRRWQIIRMLIGAVRHGGFSWRTAARFYRLCDFRTPTDADKRWLATLPPSVDQRRNER